MKSFKKILLVLVLFLSFGVVSACNGLTKTTTTTTTTTENKNKEYTLEFETDGGSTIAPMTYKAGEKITLPADPTKTGVTFRGWYADINLEEPFVLPESMPAESLTIYAKWEVELKFETNGGSAVESFYGQPADVIKMPANPTFGENVFVGWFTDAELTTPFASRFLPATNTTLYAKWQVMESATSYNLLANPVNNLDKDAYDVVQNADGLKVTTTSKKGEWSCIIIDEIKFDASAYSVISMVAKAPKDTKVLFKLEAGGLNNWEEQVVFTGEEQKINLVVSNQFGAEAGRKFIIFVAPGENGSALENQVTVEFKSIKLFVSKGMNDTVNEGAIFFNTNGGSQVPTLFGKVGDAVSEPSAISKEGFIFDGWYTDKEFTTKYEFNTLKAGTTTVYAKWLEKEEPALDQKVDKVVANKGWKDNGDNCYTVTEANGVTTIVAGTNKGEWSTVALDVSELEVAGAVVWRLYVQGPAGKQILLKVNNSKEKWVDLTGETQLITWEFDGFALEGSSSLLIFVAGAQTLTEEMTVVIKDSTLYVPVKTETTIEEVEANTGWKDNGDNCYTITEADGVTTIVAGTNKGEWSTVALDASELEVVGALGWKLVVNGPAGKQILLKVNNAKEQWVNLTGEDQEVVWEFDGFTLDSSVNLLIFVAGGQVLAEEMTVVIKESVLLVPGAEEEPTIKEVGANTGWADNGDSCYTVTEADGVTTIVAGTNKGEWSTVALNVSELNVTGAIGWKLVVNGLAGKQILLKVNNAKEQWVDLTGVDQEVVWEFSDFTLDGSINLLIFVAGGQVLAEEMTVVIKESVLLVPGAEDNKLEGVEANTGWADNGDNCYTVTEADGVTTIVAGTNKGEWSTLGLNVSELEVAGATAWNLVVNGPAGKQILLKVNNAKEKWVDLTGEDQEIIWEFGDFTLDSSINLLIFVAGGQVLTEEMTVVIKQSVLVVPEVEEEISLKEVEANTGWADNGDNCYTVTEADGVTTIVAGTNKGEWSTLALNVSELEVVGATGWKLVVNGPAEKQILLKVNNAKELWVTLTGADQEIVWEFDGFTLDGTSNLLIFVAGGQVLTEEMTVVVKDSVLLVPRA